MDPISAELSEGIEAIAYKNGGASVEDIQRWFAQGIVFANQNISSTDSNESPVTYLLRQCHGGPCGILAAIQAEICRYLFFEVYTDLDTLEGFRADPDTVSISVAQSIARIISRASFDGSNITVAGFDPSIATNYDGITLDQFTSASFSSYDECFEHIYCNIDQFSSELGCVLVLFSLILSRGIDNIRKEMDDPSNTLIGQYGHCNQELINLLLVGRASSNVIDGDISMENGTNESETFAIRGIPHRSTIGYLTYMECFRLCQVGKYYKIPEVPVWVVGSSSHFTVLFSLSREINKLSENEEMYSLLRKVFNSADVQQCGFITSDRLGSVLSEIGLSQIANDSQRLAQLRGLLRVEGDIIIWSSFWQNVSRLMVGESLEALFTQNHADGFSAVSDSKVNETRVRSDSDIARELQASFDDNNNGNNTNINNINSINNIDYMDDNGNGVIANRLRSDSDIARELQREFDNSLDNNNNNTNSNANGNVNGVTSVDGVSGVVANASEQNPMALNINDIHIDNLSSPTRVEAVMYHYNGMVSGGRDANITAFKVTYT